MTPLGLSPTTVERIRERARILLRRHRGLSRAFTLLLAYGAWIAVFRLLFLTFITYFVMSSPVVGPAAASPRRFEEVSEAFSASEVGIMALAALSFVVLAKALNPLSRTSIRVLFSRERFEKGLLPGFARGAVLSGGIALAYLLSGTHRYLGFFIQTENAILAIINVVVRIASLFILIYFEEYLFREKMLGFIRQDQDETDRSGLGSAALISVFYCLIKLLQFDLGLMHVVTLFLLSLALSLRAREEKDFAWGAGYWTALLIVFNALLSLPVLGSEFSGVLLLKYQSPLALLPEGDSDATVRLLTGGAGGPLSSFAFQALLLLNFVRGTLQGKKMLLSGAARRLR